MEGMPRIQNIVPSLRAPVSVYDENFEYQIKEYILLHFQADPSDYEEPIKEIMHMKQSISSPHYDVESSCVLKRYFSQLLMMKNRFPMERGDQINVPFSWQDQISESSGIITHPDITYELASVMYQIGAVHSQIASQQGRETEDSIKNAFMHFQCAAFPFQYMRDNMELAKFNCLDFDKDLLTFYVNILLAQAQECLVEKSVNDHRKSIVVAKLTIYLRELYKSCLSHIDKTLSNVLSSKKMKLWTTICFIKMELYACITMLYLGMNAEEEKKFGFRLGYYQVAKGHLDNMFAAHDRNLSDMRDTLQFLHDVIVGKLDNAKKENDFIYHERIPSAEELNNSSMEGLCKVKCLGFDPLDPSVGGEDIFSTLLPPTVLTSVSQYEEQKAKLKRDVLQEIEEKDDELQSFLIALNASELGLNDSAADAPVPDHLLERNAALTAQPDAVPKILEDLQNVNGKSLEAESKLSSLQDRLAAIDMPELREDEGYKAICKEVERLNEHHLQARSNNGKLHSALAAHSANLHLLTLPLHELKSKLNPIAITSGLTEEGTTLKKFLDKVDEMQTQRATLVQRFNEELSADDISKRLLAERDTNCSHIFDKELKKHDQTIQYIRMNLAAQPKILSGLTEANADFADQRRKIQESNNKRNEQIITLITAFDIYSDVCEKVNEGKRFYEKLLDRVDRLGLAVKGMENAYSSEKQKRQDEMRALEDKMKSLRAAREARAALSDFSMGPMSQMDMSQMGPPGPGAPHQTSTTNNAGRGRIVDYKEFYRNKMGLPSQSVAPMGNIGSNGHHMPPQLHVNEQYGGYGGGSTQPPSPAPSSVCDYHYIPVVERYTPHNVPQYPPQGVVQYPSQNSTQYPPQNAPQYPPQEYNLPKAPQQQTMPSQRATVADPRFEANPPSGLPPQNWIPQSQVPYNQYNQQSYQNVPTHMGSQQDVANNYSPMPPNQQQQFSNSNQTNNQQQNSVPSTQGSNQMNSMNHSERLPQSGGSVGYSGGANSVPVTSHYGSQPNQPIPNSSQMAPVTQFGYNYPPQMRPYQQQSSQDSSQNGVMPQYESNKFSNVMPQQTSMGSHSYSTNSLSSSIQSSGVSPSNSSTSTITPVPSSTSFTPPVYTHQTQQPLNSQNNNPSAQLTPQPNIQPQQPQQYYQPFNQTQKIQQPSLPQHGPPTSINTGNIPPTIPSNQPAPYASSQPFCPPTQGLQTQSQQHNFNSVWHKSVQQPGTTSPWHNGVRSNNVMENGSHSANVIVHPQQHQQNYSFQGAHVNNQAPQPMMQQAGPPQVYNVQPAGPQSNVDLLSSLLGSIDPTPAMQPYPAGQNGMQSDLRAAPIASTIKTVPEASVSSQRAPQSLSIPSTQPEQQAALLQRPSASVLPIPQKTASQHHELTQVLSMAYPTPVSNIPQPSADVKEEAIVFNVTDLLDASKFTIGEGDKKKLDKKLLHSSIRGNGEKPPLDLSDPLNQFDPFWKVNINSSK